MKSTNERDSHFFLAGWNGARRDVDATEHFQNASKTAPTSCLHQIQEPAPATAMDALREAEAALEVAIARILKADPGHSISVTSEAKALVAVRAALAAPAAVAVPENVREGAPYDNPAFEKLARELGVWGTAQSAVCAQFWLAATPATVNQQLTIEREFEDWWTDSPEMNEFLFQNGIDDSKGGQQSLFFAAAYIAWQARAALSATPAAAPVIPSELIEAVDAWFAQNTGLGGCSDKDVAELAAIFAAAAPVTLPEPWGYLVEGRIFIGRLLPQHVSSMVDAEGFEPTKLYTEPQMRALLATASAETEPFGYFKAEPFGWTDCGPDDEGAVALYERPQAQAKGNQDE